MNSFEHIPPVLSIRQPWVDLILRREKTIEVREWRVAHRGPLLIHASRTLDWKTIELLGYEDAQLLPRGGVVAVVEVLGGIEFTHESWLELQPRHRVVHPPVRQPIFGVQLGEVIEFREPIACRGRSSLFSLPSAVEGLVRQELTSLDLMQAATPD